MCAFYFRIIGNSVFISSLNGLVFRRTFYQKQNFVPELNPEEENHSKSVQSLYIQTIPLMYQTHISLKIYVFDKNMRNY